MDHQGFWREIAAVTAQIADDRGWVWVAGWGWMPIKGDRPQDQKDSVTFIESNRL